MSEALENCTDVDQLHQRILELETVIQNYINGCGDSPEDYAIAQANFKTALEIGKQLGLPVNSRTVQFDNRRLEMALRETMATVSKLRVARDSREAEFSVQLDKITTEFGRQIAIFKRDNILLSDKAGNGANRDKERAERLLSSNSELTGELVLLKQVVNSTRKRHYNLCWGLVDATTRVAELIELNGFLRAAAGGSKHIEHGEIK